MRTFGRRLGIALGVAGLISSLLVPTVGAAAEGRKALSDSLPGWATPKGGRQADANAQVVFRVYLGWRDAAGAAALARAVSDPKSPQYRQFLSPAEFRHRFAPNPADVNAVKTWLKEQGFRMGHVPANGHYVEAAGTVGQAAAAFRTAFRTYEVDGQELTSPAVSPSVPSTLGAVSAVVGLDDSAALVHTNIVTDAPPLAGFRNAPPCSIYWAEKVSSAPVPPAYGVQQPYAPCGYTPQQLRGAYGVDAAIAAGNDGRGQTVAVIDAYASPTLVADVNEWSERHGLPPFAPGQLTTVFPPGIANRSESTQNDPQGWYSEQTLDIEAVHTMAPAAKVVYVGSPNNRRNLDAALNHTIDRHLAQIITDSWGFTTELVPPGFVKSVNDSLIQAAATGIGVYFSTGDNGDESGSFGFPTTEFPVSSPWVTGVGGTSLGVGPANDYLFETGWQTTRAALVNGAWSPVEPGSYLYGGGGGSSCQFGQPSWQAGVVPDAIARLPGRVCGSFLGRALPDISLDGDIQTGFLLGLTQTFPDGVHYGEYRIGGTSMSSPLMAGLMALADQRAGSPHGLATPALYGLYGTSAVRDVLPAASPIAVVRVDFLNGVDASGGLGTTLRTTDFQGQAIKTLPGYDALTGIGSPNGASFLDALD